MSDASASSAHAENALRAVANGEFIPVYQPIVRLQDGAPIGVEALARWRHPAEGLLTPARFIDALQDPEAAEAISDAILDQALSDSVRFEAAGFSALQVSVNAAERQLLRDDFAADVLRRAAERNASPAKLLVELTEMVILSRAPKTIASQLSALRAQGVQAAFDDFGTGFASLSHLKAFPIDRLKIDRSFVGALTENAQDQAIVRAVIGLGRDLGLNVVAEGVETEAAAAMLRELGCEYAQGYFFGRPEPFDDALSVLRALSEKAGSPD